MYKLKSVLFVVLCAKCPTSGAQSTYYDRQAQNREYDRLHEATSRAFAVPASTSSPGGYRPSSSSPSSSSSSGSSSRSNAGGSIAPATANSWALTDYHDWQVRQGEKLERARADRKKAFEQDVSRYRSLIADRGVARTEADHFDLLLTGLRQSIDYRAIEAVIGYDIADYRRLFGTTGEAFKPGDPAALRANMFIGAALKEKDPLNRAAYYAEAVGRFPTAALTQNMADAYREAMRYTEAIEAYKKSDGIEPNRFAVLFGWATAAAMLGDAAEAERQYLRALTVAPGAPVGMNIAWMRVLSGNIPGALESFQKDATDRPGDPGPLLAQAALTTDLKIRTALTDKAALLRPALAPLKPADQLFAHAKYLQEDGAYELSLLFLDLAVAAEPRNIDFVELRYGTNRKLKRNKQADADEKLLERLLK